MAQYVVKELLTNNKLDIIIARANYNSLKGSFFNEILDVIQEEGYEELFKTWNFPLRIKCVLTQCNVVFGGIGGSDKSKVRGLKTVNPVSAVIIDEAQQIPEQTNLDHALATYRRRLVERPDKLGKIILAYNPEPQNSHWMNKFRMSKENDDTWLCIYSTYHDIAKFLTRNDLYQIELERIQNEKYYKYLYLGETTGMFGSVYYAFDRNKHLKMQSEVYEMLEMHKVYSLVIGVDGATTRDSTAFVPLAILRNGQAIRLDYFFHNPMKRGSLSNEQLFPYVKIWLDKLLEKYNIRRNVPIYMSIDPAGNSDLRQHLEVHRYQLGNCTIVPFTKKDLVKNSQVVNNAFSRNALVCLDDRGYYDYTIDRFVREDVAVEELESVIWNETGKKYDDIVPNDFTDALKYGVNLWYGNPYNLYIVKSADYYK